MGMARWSIGFGVALAALLLVPSAAAQFDPLAHPYQNQVRRQFGVTLTYWTPGWQALVGPGGGADAFHQRVDYVSATAATLFPLRSRGYWRIGVTADLDVATWMSVEGAGVRSAPGGNELSIHTAALGFSYPLSRRIDLLANARIPLGTDFRAPDGDIGLELTTLRDPLAVSLTAAFDLSPAAPSQASGSARVVFVINDTNSVAAVVRMQHDPRRPIQLGWESHLYYRPSERTLWGGGIALATDGSVTAMTLRLSRSVFW